MDTMNLDPLMNGFHRIPDTPKGLRTVGEAIHPMEIPHNNQDSLFECATGITTGTFTIIKENLKTMIFVG